jgi:beta-phosphoglucomutase
LNLSVIFDMDGVIIDSNPYHKKAWMSFCNKHNITISDNDLETKIFGRTGEDVLPVLFNRPLDNVLIAEYRSEVNKNYRDLYAPYIKPLRGLKDFLEELDVADIKYAIATSAPPVNVEFVLSETKLENYFDIIVDDTMIARGKPDPEIYLITASKMKVSPSDCIVFEDSLAGIKAAQAAGMKVIGITTTHSHEELSHTDLAISDFTDITISDLFKVAMSNHSNHSNHCL